jgi:hypothetical protein
MLLIFVPVRSVTAEPSRVYVDPPTVVDPPEFFNVSVKVDNVQGLVGVELKLYWNPALLYGVNMTEVIFHEVMPQEKWNNITEEVYINNTRGIPFFCLRVFEFERRGHLWAVAGKLHGGCCHVQSG